MGVKKNSQPRTTKNPASPTINQFGIQFGMIDVADFKRPVTMAWSRLVDVPLEFGQWI